MEAGRHPFSPSFARRPRGTDQRLHNALLFNVDGFFDALFTGGENVPPDTVIVYTADHGQTLAEHGETWTHGLNTPNEAKVPMFVISRTPLDVDVGYRASHSNIFPTLLDLMEFPDGERLVEYEPSLLRARATDSTPRHFYTGPFDGRGAHQVVAFDRAF